MEHIAIFGGTFDPIHNGHLQTSLSIQSSFKFDTIFFTMQSSNNKATHLCQ